MSSRRECGPIQGRRRSRTGNGGLGNGVLMMGLLNTFSMSIVDPSVDGECPGLRILVTFAAVPRLERYYHEIVLLFS